MGDLYTEDIYEPLQARSETPENINCLQSVFERISSVMEIILVQQQHIRTIEILEEERATKGNYDTFYIRSIYKVSVNMEVTVKEHLQFTEILFIVFIHKDIKNSEYLISPVI